MDKWVGEDVMPDFEESFSDFLERREYDEVGAALFSIVRTAFKAGWHAAGGQALPPQKVVEIIRPNSRDAHLESIESDSKHKNK